MAPITITASTISPVMPFFLSWRIIHTRNATSGNTKIAQNINDGILMLIIELLFE
jgi:hypothetical protein